MLFTLGPFTSALGLAAAWLTTATIDKFHKKNDFSISRSRLGSCL
ncbi:hypothetical protein [Pontibacillus salicampi]